MYRKIVEGSMLDGNATKGSLTYLLLRASRLFLALAVKKRKFLIGILKSISIENSSATRAWDSNI